MLKKIFGRKEEKGQRELTIEDLITLERYDEAAERLRTRVKRVPKDLHAHLKLAEVYLELKELNKAIDEYMYVADSYAEDGFFDKGIALLGKAAKLMPADDMLPKRIERFKRLKRLEHRRRLAIEGLLANRSAVASATHGSMAGNSALEVEMLWNKIAKSHLVETLTGEQLKKMFSVMEMSHITAGESLAKQGENDATMYLVVSGVVSAASRIDGRYTEVRSFSTGDLIGESVLLERKAWPAHYKVTESGTVFRLNRSGFEKVMVGNEDPRGFIDVLRRQHNDRDVVASIQRLQAGGGG